MKPVPGIMRCKWQARTGPQADENCNLDDAVFWPIDGFSREYVGRINRLKVKP